MRRKLISLLLLSLVSSVLIIALLVAGYYALVRRDLIRQSREETRLRLEDTGMNVDRELRRDLESAGVLANYGNMLSDFMDAPAEDRLDRRDDVRFLLSMQLDTQPGLKYICLYTVTGSRMFISSEALPNISRAAAREVATRVAEDYRLSEDPGRTRFSSVYATQDGAYYSIIAPVRQSAGNRYLGSLILLYDGASFRNLLTTRSGLPYIVSDGELLLTASNPEIEEAWRDGLTQMETVQLSVSGWEMSTTMFVPELRYLLRTLLQACWAAVAITMTAFAVLIVFQYRRIVKPVVSITDRVAEIERDPQKEMDLHFGVAEYDALSESISAMIHYRQRTHDEMMQIRTDAYEGQISFLQSQINPHFLYNSFESIRGMAGRGMMEETRRTVSCIAAVYRYCSKGGPYAMLRDECECAENYSTAMNMCYGSAYQIEIRPDAGTEERIVPRMMLQPLIENAVIHGFRRAGKSTGHIWVTASVENDILTLRVTDDGVGLTQEQADYWNNSWESAKDVENAHIGLPNVLRRVHLLYGDRATVNFGRGPEDTGLEITFVFRPESASTVLNK